MQADDRTVLTARKENGAIIIMAGDDRQEIGLITEGEAGYVASVHSVYPETEMSAPTLSAARDLIRTYVDEQDAFLRGAVVDVDAVVEKQMGFGF